MGTEYKKRSDTDKPIFTPMGVVKAKEGRFKANYQITELGLEKRCSKCGEFWPADTGFFSPNSNTLHSHCQGCSSEKKRLEREAIKNTN